MLRLNRPRVEPLPEPEWDEELRRLFMPEGGKLGPVANIFRTLARHPKLLKRWRVFANHVLFKNALPPRERELLILRVGWLCQAAYEWNAHVRIGKESGLSQEEIERVRQGPEAPGWNAFDRALLTAADELRGDAFITDDTWKRLSERYDTRQMLDVIFTVGNYNLVCMALNSLGVQIDE